MLELLSRNNIAPGLGRGTNLFLLDTMITSCKVENCIEMSQQFCPGLVNTSYSVADFGYPTIRNYFETSHAKGPQDGASANLKFKADMAVITRQKIIQNTVDLYEFTQEQLQVRRKGQA